MRMAITEFKAKCTQIIREVDREGRMVEVTKRGKIVAIVSPSRSQKRMDPKRYFGSLKGTVALLPGWDEPLGDKDWEAGR